MRWDIFILNIFKAAKNVVQINYFFVFTFQGNGFQNLLFLKFISLNIHTS